MSAHKAAGQMNYFSLNRALTAIGNTHGILEGKSKYVVHALRKVDLFGKKSDL